MPVYADTGFIASLYFRETTTGRALTEIATLTEPITLLWLGELELLSAFKRAVFTGRITPDQGSQLEEQFRDDLNKGMFTTPDIDPLALAADAGTLISQYTATIGLRTLDALHISMATLTHAHTFLSFDHRQRAAATAVGLRVLPVTV
jgi:predicted nucleic acid-binding protein